MNVNRDESLPDKTKRYDYVKTLSLSSREIVLSVLDSNEDGDFARNLASDGRKGERIRLVWTCAFNKMP